MNEHSPLFSIFADGKDFAFDPPVSEPSCFAFTPSSSYIAMQDRDRLQSTGCGFERGDNQDIFLPDGETLSSDHWDFNPPCPDAAWISSLSDLSPTILPRGQVAPPGTTLAPADFYQDVTPPISERAAPTGRKYEFRTKVADTSVEQYTPTSSTTEIVRGRKSTTRHRRSTFLRQEEKRKLSLEKNRMAAAKCRIKRKDRAELLQRSLHDQTLRNAFLKQEISSLEEETRRLQSCLVSHSTSGGCNMPAEIHQVLRQLKSEHSTLQVGNEQADRASEMGSDSRSEKSVQVDDRWRVSSFGGYFQPYPFLDVISLNETTAAPAGLITVGA
jgi:hypothetical protein